MRGRKAIHKCTGRTGEERLIRQEGNNADMDRSGLINLATPDQNVNCLTCEGQSTKSEGERSAESES